MEVLGGGAGWRCWVQVLGAGAGCRCWQVLGGGAGCKARLDFRIKRFGPIVCMIDSQAVSDELHHTERRRRLVERAAE